ncbi:MAG: glycosyltransferase family 2 protein [Defluviimonas sp.]|nr:glycosyltransferase family 2 protein [Defluviimonas sp.]
MDPQPPATDPSPLATGTASGTASGTAFDIAPADRGQIGAGRGIAVIIVNYRTAELTALGVESVLARRHGGRPVEVHVVENASPGGEDARLLSRWHAERGWGARVTLWLETENHGFGRGNNVVLRALAKRPVPPEYVFLLNPDARLKIETLAILADYMDAHPKVGITGCGIDRPDLGQGLTTARATFNFPSIWGEFASALSFGPVDRLLARKLTSCPPPERSCKVDWVSGAALMARFEAIRAVGFFDPDYFLYFEETDLMRRVTRAGWEIWHVTGASVEHEAGAATGMQGGQHRSKALPGYWYDSWRMYFAKNHGRGYALATALARIAGWGLNLPLTRLRGRRPAGPQNFLPDFSRHVLGPLLRSSGDRP